MVPYEYSLEATTIEDRVRSPVLPPDVLPPSLPDPLLDPRAPAPASQLPSCRMYPMVMSLGAPRTLSLVVSLDLVYPLVASHFLSQHSHY